MTQRTKEQTQTIELEKQTQRLSDIETKAGEMLTSLEEATLRMHHGISLKPEGVLATNALSEPLREELLEIELNAFEQTGRIEQLPDLPPHVLQQKLSPRAQSIVEKLKQ
jgi:hypothetical protein